MSLGHLRLYIDRVDNLLTADLVDFSKVCVGVYLYCYYYITYLNK